MTFPERLKELRTENNVSQVKLAGDIRYSVSMISKWETGERNPNLKAILALAKYFDVSVDYLLGKTDY